MSSEQILTDARTTHPFIQCENQQRFIVEHKWRCCLNCLYINVTLCKRNGLAIPPQVAVIGCGDYDDLPF